MADDVVLGFMLEGYEEFEEVGRGGFGIVYRARETSLARTIAVKILSGPFDDTARRRLDRERQAMGMLSGHPNIVTVYATGYLTDGRPYIVMEYLPGGNLAERVAETPLPWQDAVRIGAKVAGALHAAHGLGVLHRDVKPENVLMSPYGEPKLGDFGIAVVADATRSGTGMVSATVAHAPPEVLNGERATEASDVYSLASTIYAFMAGGSPFVRESDESIMPVYSRVLSEPVPDLRPRGIPDSVCAVIEHAMQKSRDERIATADELSSRLIETLPDAREVREEPPPAPPPPPPKPAKPAKPSKPAKRRTAPATATGVTPHPPEAPPDTHRQKRPPAAPPTRRRRPLVVAGVAILLVAALIGGAVLLTGGGAGGGGDGDGGDHAEEGAGFIDTSGTVTSRFVAVADGAVWITDGAQPGSIVVRLDRRTGKVTDRIDVGVVPDDIVAAATGVWVSDFGDRAFADYNAVLVRVDPATNAVAAEIDIGGGSLALADDAVWLSDPRAGTVSRIDATTDQITGVLDFRAVFADDPLDIAVGEGAVWVTHSSGLARIDPATNVVVADVDLGSETQAVAAGVGGVWVAHVLGFAGFVSRIDPATNGVTAQIAVDLDERPQIAVGEGSVWVLRAGGVDQIDPATSSIARQIEVSDGDRIAVGEGSVWVTNFEEDSVVRIDAATGEVEDTIKIDRG
ncbi:MAG TPA: protein kinase [Acidimicrobiia bacterium]|nr:protein kinase [Acidimicrobiia bacterium]